MFVGGYDILVRERATGRIVLELPLPNLVFPGSIPHMPLAAADPGEGAKALGPAVAGRIAGAPSDLEAALTEWSAAMRARNMRAATIRAYTTCVGRAIRQEGWRTWTDVAGGAMLRYLHRAAAEHRWQPQTFNCHLSAFRRFVHFGRQIGALEANPLELAEEAIVENRGGLRAATLDEARALLQACWLREKTDRRARGTPTLYWMMLFGAGCRVGEPERLHWRHVVLEGSVPYIDWPASLQKNRLHAQVALTTELAALLRARFEAVRPGPDDPVFPVVPTRTTFRALRRRAGIAARDARGLGFATHSARKFFSTTLTSIGVGERLAKHLTRHTDGSHGKYHDPSLEEQDAALAGFPRLWPDQFSTSCPQGRGKSEKDLTEPAVLGDIREPTQCTSRQDKSIEPPAPPAVSIGSAKSFAPARARGSGDLSHCEDAPGQGHVARSGPVRSADFTGSIKPRVGLEPTTCGLQNRCSTN